ncbi:hypothetical protein H9L39_10227 [Fusarium oxysporum f. sp. albedinis]|nr:hypothetical protein H9L39_10227 [Fusarium oxysporum f. sp. albedinis]
MTIPMPARLRELVDLVSNADPFAGSRRIAGDRPASTSLWPKKTTSGSNFDHKTTTAIFLLGMPGLRFSRSVCTWTPGEGLQKPTD